MAKITVLGSGGWGMALAISAFNNRNQVTLWSPFEEEVKMLKEKQIDGMIFLTNCVMGIGLPSEYWLREWIERNKNIELGE